jgi:cytochrome P450
MIDEDFGDVNPGITITFGSCQTNIFISDPTLLNELYVTKNKFFDKHHAVYEAFKPLVGDSILFSRSDEEWAKRRKTLSAAFYKEKLLKMT